MDITSFDLGSSRGMMTAVQDFVVRLAPSDHVGLVAFPDGTTVKPTTDHDVVRQALHRVVACASQRRCR